MIVRLSALLVVLACAAASPVAAAAGDASDDFERSQLGSSWTVHLGRVGIINRSDVGFTAASPIGIVTWSGSRFDADQFSEATISTDKAPNMLVQVFVRWRESDKARYGFHYASDPNASPRGPDEWQLKYDGVPTEQTRLLATNSQVGPPRPGDTIRLEVRGADPVELKGYRNGALILSARHVATTAIAAGPPGMAFRLQVESKTTYPTPVFERWTGGSLAPSAPPTTTSSVPPTPPSPTTTATPAPPSTGAPATTAPTTATTMAALTPSASTPPTPSTAIDDRQAGDQRRNDLTGAPAADDSGGTDLGIYGAAIAGALVATGGSVVLLRRRRARAHR